MRALSVDGKTLDQHVAKFSVMQDEEVDEKKLAALTNHFAKSPELERYSLERQIERVKSGGSPDEPSDGDEPADANAAPGKKPQKPIEDGKPERASGEGKLPRESVQRVVRSHNPAIRLCYEQALREDPTLKGEVEVAFTIGLDGNVSATSTGPKTDLPDPSVVACVKRVFQKMEFPMPEGGVVKVSYPITFAP
jgi:outer membrane biosynthesis protein TonB